MALASVASRPTSCFLWGGAEIKSRLEWIVRLIGVQGARGQYKAQKSMEKDVGESPGQGVDGVAASRSPRAPSKKLGLGFRGLIDRGHSGTRIKWVWGPG